MLARQRLQDRVKKAENVLVLESHPLSGPPAIEQLAPPQGFWLDMLQGKGLDGSEAMCVGSP
jgi:hypothetical protein